MVEPRGWISQGDYVLTVCYLSMKPDLEQRVSNLTSMLSC